MDLKINNFFKSYNDYNIMVTNRCNWFCPYCIVDTHNLKNFTISIDNIKEYMEEIPDYSIVNISGGEPGLLEYNIMDFLINSLYKKNCKIKIFTNGMWIKKYHKYIDKIYYIIYHISYTLEPVHIPRIKLPIRIDYKIVIDDNNFEKMEEFIKLNPYVDEIVAAQGKHGLSKRNFIKLIKIYKDNNYPCLRKLIKNTPL